MQRIRRCAAKGRQLYCFYDIVVSGIGRERGAGHADPFECDALRPSWRSARLSKRPDGWNCWGCGRRRGDRSRNLIAERIANFLQPLVVGFLAESSDGAVGRVDLTAWRSIAAVDFAHAEIGAATGVGRVGILRRCRRRYEEVIPCRIASLVSKCCRQGGIAVDKFPAGGEQPSESRVVAAAHYVPVYRRVRADVITELIVVAAIGPKYCLPVVSGVRKRESIRQVAVNVIRLSDRQDDVHVSVEEVDVSKISELVQLPRLKPLRCSRIVLSDEPHRGNTKQQRKNDPLHRLTSLLTMSIVSGSMRMNVSVGRK